MAEFDKNLRIECGCTLVISTVGSEARFQFQRQSGLHHKTLFKTIDSQNKCRIGLLRGLKGLIRGLKPFFLRQGFCVMELSL